MNLCLRKSFPFFKKNVATCKFDNEMTFEFQVMANYYQWYYEVNYSGYFSIDHKKTVWADKPQIFEILFLI